MKVVLIQVEGLGPVFVAEPDAEDLPTAGGFLGWMSRRRTSMIAAMENPRGRVGAFFGKIWTWLQSRISPVEHLLRRLRTADSLAIHHPARMDPEEVHRLWSGLLKHRLRKHRTWLVIDTLLAVPGAFLALLPGPNVIGYWLAYRAVVHLLVVLGIRSAKAIPISLVPRTVLDESVKSGDDEAIAKIADHLEIPAFPSLLAAYAPPPEAR